MNTKPPAEVVAQDGSARSFGNFLKELKDRRAIKVTRLVADAGLSRANYYLLEGDKQRPSLATVVSLLSILGVETQVPSPDDADLEKDLDIRDGEKALVLRINWSAVDRKRSREKFWTTAGVGLGAATSAGFAPWGAVMAAGGAGLPLAAAVGGAAAALFPASLPVAGVALAAKLLHERSKSKTGGTAGDTDGSRSNRAPDRDIKVDFAKAADEMSTEELGALLEAMKAMRDQRDEGDAGQSPA